MKPEAEQPPTGLFIVAVFLNSTYSFPDVWLIELRTDCHDAAPLGVTVSPPLLNVMPLAVASAEDHCDVLGVTGPPSHA